MAEPLPQGNRLERPLEDSPLLQPAGEPSLEEIEDEATQSRLVGPGLLAKLVVFLVASLSLLAAISGVLAAMAMRNQQATNFRDQGEIIANSIAAAAASSLESGNLTSLDNLVRQQSERARVNYVFVTDASQNTLSSTLESQFLDKVQQDNRITGATPIQAAELTIGSPIQGGERNILDVATPIAGGRLGSVHVGMDLDQITRQTTADALRIMGILGTLALIACLIGYLFARRMVQPIRGLVGVAQRVGQGDLGQLAPVTTGDEIGLLAGTFNTAILRLRGLISTQAEGQERERSTRESLQKNINDFLQVSMGIAQGDLTRRGEVTEDVLGNVVDSINVAVEEIGDLLLTVRQTSDSVNQGAQGMIGLTNQMEEGARIQTTDANRVREAVEEMAQAMRQVSQDAETSAGAARQTLAAAEQGRVAVSSTLEGMQKIRAEVQSISKRIKSLGDRSLEISEIVETINNISSQTNLLALNAAIEASSAGAEGTRFAVVAEEVRKLAEDAAVATKRIAGLIRSVQSEIQDAVVAIEEGTKEVESGSRVANLAGERLAEISTISDSSAQLAQQISSGTQGQVNRVERVVEGVASINEVSAQNEQSVRDGRQAAEQLVDLAAQLTQNISRFRLES